MQDAMQTSWSEWDGSPTINQNKEHASNAKTKENAKTIVDMMASLKGNSYAFLKAGGFFAEVEIFRIFNKYYSCLLLIL